MCESNFCIWLYFWNVVEGIEVFKIGWKYSYELSSMEVINCIWVIYKSRECFNISIYFFSFIDGFEIRKIEIIIKVN